MVSSIYKTVDNPVYQTLRDRVLESVNNLDSVNATESNVGFRRSLIEATASNCVRSLRFIGCYSS